MQPLTNNNDIKNPIPHKEDIYAILETVCDPEIPVLTILDLGIVRDVLINNEGIEVKITPTYSGCPAMDAIAADIRFRLLEHGYKNTKVSQVLHPVWTTDWMTESGKRKLKEYGIAPPARLREGRESLTECPACGSKDTEVISAFGSTACKELCRCHNCLEIFDHFKCH